MANPRCAENLGKNLGSRDPAHISRWLAGRRAGLLAAPKCEAISKGTGLRCRSPAPRGSCFCFRHLSGGNRAHADHERADRHLQTLARSSNRFDRVRAEAGLQAIARRQVHLLWRTDPRAPNVSTLELDERREAAVRDWLRDNCGVSLGSPLPGGGRAPTARATDRMRWAAYRVLRRGEGASGDFIERAKLRVAAAIRDDARFWEKWARLGGGDD
jgi:hypothetical protein